MDNNQNNNQNDLTTNPAVGYFGRVFNNEAARKGLAAAGAGLLVAAITELVWPSNRP